MSRSPGLVLITPGGWGQGLNPVKCDWVTVSLGPSWQAFLINVVVGLISKTYDQETVISRSRENGLFIESYSWWQHLHLCMYVSLLPALLCHDQCRVQELGKVICGRRSRPRGSNCVLGHFFWLNIWLRISGYISLYTYLHSRHTSVLWYCRFSPNSSRFSESLFTTVDDIKVLSQCPHLFSDQGVVTLYRYFPEKMFTAKC